MVSDDNRHAIGWVMVWVCEKTRAYVLEEQFSYWEPDTVQVGR
jgi:hypothetical protein